MSTDAGENAPPQKLEGRKRKDENAQPPPQIIGRKLNPSHGKFLYHLRRVSLLETTTRLVTQDEIRASVEETRETEPENILSDKMIGPLAAELQRHLWKKDAVPYVISHGRDGYWIEGEAHITLAVTAKIVMELFEWRDFEPGHQQQIPQHKFEERFSSRFKTNIDDVKRLLGWLKDLNLKYVGEYPASPGYIYADKRASLEFEYIKRLASLFTPPIHARRQPGLTQTKVKRRS